MERTNLPKCKCGCGKCVKNIKRQYLLGHNLKNISKESELKRIKKIGLYQKKRFENPEVKMKQGLIWKGRKHSEETKQLLSVLRTGKGNGMFGKQGWNKNLPKELNPLTGRHHSEETKRKISEAQKGKNIPIEQRKQISETLKMHYINNENAFKGKHHSQESLEKMSVSLKGKYTGEKASNWQGGIDAFPYAIGWTPNFIESIRIRDDHKCQNPRCKNPHKLLDVHHIDYDKQNNALNNLITICKRCHDKTQKHRRYWMRHYQNVVMVKNLQKII